jgi:hypothetical protein
MFEEDENVEKAANVEESVESQPTSPVEKEPVDQTKAFAARLKEEKAKAKLDVQKEIAESFGYASWDEYINAQTNNKLIDKGLDPETVRPVIKDLIKNDPEYIEAMKFKEEKEALEKEMFANASIKALNDKFGTNFTSVDELDKETIDDWNKGTPLEKAFAANNYSKLMEMAVKKANSNADNGKSHLKTVTGSSEKSNTRELSKDELGVFKMFGFTEEQAKNYVNRTNK